MKRFIVLLAIILAGCSLFIPDDYDPQFDIPASCATTPVEVCQWVDARVIYLGDEIHDRLDYWQSPDQTFEWGRGDCEDYAILVLYLIHRDLGGWPELAVGTVGGNGHGWVAYNGHWYEPQTGGDVTDNPLYVLSRAVPYGEALWRSTHAHRSLKEKG